MPREFDINILMRLCEKQRYAAAVAGFEVIDTNDAINVPKILHKNKPAVRAMNILDMKLIKWDYIGEEERQALREELGLVPPQELEGEREEAKAEAKSAARSEKNKDKTENTKSKAEKTKSK